MARGLGLQPMRDFGVAIATIKYRDKTLKQDKAASTQEPQAASTSELTADRSDACAQ